MPTHKRKAKKAKRKSPPGKQPYASKTVAPRRPLPAMRVCLSGFGTLHSFISGSPAERMCPGCRRRLDAVARSVSPTMLNPVAHRGGLS